MKIVTMGEIMLRLMTPGFLRLEQTDTFDAIYDGDEAIVATSLARLGMKVTYLTKLPNGPLGEACLKRLRAENVSCEEIARGDGRLGINFYETGVGIRPPRVFYDREGSVFSKALPEEFDFDRIFEDADWFHITGITPAISEEAEKLTYLAMETAKRKGVTVSFDFNYRKKLWTEERARSVIQRLLPFVDVCIAGKGDAKTFLGIEEEGYEELFGAMKEKYGFRFMACSLRESFSASDNGWSVLGYDGERLHQSRRYQIHLVDRGGAGAAFAAGLIYSLMKGFPLEETVEFAGAISAIKHTVYGGFNLTDEAEARELMQGDLTGRVQR